MGGFGKSIVGKVRKDNEDSILVENGSVGGLPNLYIVADGMGGHLAGGTASIMAVELVKDYLINNVCDNILDCLEDAAVYANEKIYARSLEDSGLSGMGTTLTAMTVFENTAYTINVGDSRLYSMNFGENEISQITVDHSFVMELLRQGKITEVEAERHPSKNVITRALGTQNRVVTDRFIYRLKKDDILLMCSDGLTNMVPNDDILQICKKQETIVKMAECLLECAEKKGGVDNISVILYNS